MVSHCGWDVSHGEVKIEETDGSCGGKKSTTSPSLFMEAYGLEVEDEISPIATQLRAEGVWTGKWSRKQKEAWMRQIREVQTWKQVRGPAGAVMCETRDSGHQMAAMAHIDVQ